MSSSLSLAKSVTVSVVEVLFCVSSCVEGGVAACVLVVLVVVVDVMSVEVVVVAAVLAVAIEAATGESGMEAVGVGRGMLRGVCGTIAWLWSECGGSAVFVIRGVPLLLLVVLMLCAMPAAVIHGIERRQLRI